MEEEILKWTQLSNYTETFENKLKGQTFSDLGRKSRDKEEKK